MFALRPAGGRNGQGFGLAGDGTTLPLCQGGKARFAEVPQSRHAVAQFVRDSPIRQQVHEDRFSRRGERHALAREVAEAVPKLARVAGRVFENRLEPAMLLPDDEGSPVFFQAIPIAVEDGLADGLGAEVQVVCFDGQEGTGGQADQIVGVGKRKGLIKIIDAPSQAAQGVPPRAEILQVKVADGQDGRGS